MSKGVKVATGRRRTIVVLVLGCALLALPIAAFAVGRDVGTRAQRIADAAPPAPSITTAAVEPGPLVDIVRAAGVVEVDDEIRINIEFLGRAVVTGALHSEGEVVSSGDVVLEVSGRPIFLLLGEFQLYRDLRIGLEGPDIAQLQVALRSHGEDLTATGRYSAETAQAVGRMYTSAGYKPVVDVMVAKELTAAQSAVVIAGEAKRKAAAELVSAKSKLPTADYLASRLEVAKAEQAEGLLVEVSKVRAAEAVHASALAELDELVATGASQDETETASRSESLLRATLERIRAEAAATELSLAQSVHDAADSLANPNASLVDVTAAVKAASAALADAKRHVAEVESRHLPLLPASEVLVVPSSPVTVSNSDVNLGLDLQQAALSGVFGLTAREPVVRLALPATQQSRIVAGQRVNLEFASGQIHSGLIRDLREAEDGHDALVPVDGLGLESTGQTLVGSITVESTGAEDVVVVPAVAVQLAANGDLFVEVLEGRDASRKNVDVVLNAAGYVALRGTSLEVGDRVVLR